MDEERDYKYDILRVFLTILVVVGHGTYYKIQTPFGGVDYSGLMLLEGVEDTKIHILTSYLTGLIYTFHMPVFFAFIIVYFIGTLKCKEVWKITLIFGLWVISVLQQSIFGNEWMPLGNPFKYSLWFGIYLWAEPLNYLILHWVYVNLGVAAFGNEVVASVIFCES